MDGSRRLAPALYPWEDTVPIKIRSTRSDISCALPGSVASGFDLQEIRCILDGSHELYAMD